MTTVKLSVNGKEMSAEVEGRTLLVEVLREKLGMTGTHVGCDTSQCGACTVHVDGRPARSCVMPVSAAEGKAVTTIESLAVSDTTLHPLQKAWIEHDVPQCGYCQAGQLMSAAALLARTPSPTDADIDRAMRGNLCRCGTYQRIRAAIHSAADEITASGGDV